MYKTILGEQRIKRKIGLLSSALLAMVALPFVTACEPPVPLKVENQTDQHVRIYVQGYPYFQVLPHETAKGDTALIIYEKFLVEALNNNGDIVYSRTFSHNEFTNQDFKLIITPTEINPYLPLEVENRSGYPVEVKVNSAPMIFPLEPAATIKRRPLPSDVTNYHIEVIADVSGKHQAGFFRTILDRVFSRSELERQDWKIVVTYPSQ